MYFDTDNPLSQSSMLCKQFQNEVQSLYFHKKTLTLFIIIAYIPSCWKNDITESDNKWDGSHIMETHAFWSDDKSQDAYVVHIAYRKLLENLFLRYPSAKNKLRKWYQVGFLRCS